MDQIAHFLTQTWVVYIFVSLIIFVASIPFYQSLFVIPKVNGELEQAILTLKKNVGTDPQKQKEEFYDQFDDTDDKIKNISLLRHAWNEFVESMFVEKTGEGMFGVVAKHCISHRPSYYFNLESVLGTRLNLPQFFAFPNYLIGIGLLCTFIGLAAALHVAQLGLASGGGQEALKDLLAVASVKFISSIAGIKLSLVLSFVQKQRIKGCDKKIDEFCHLIEKCTEYKSTEKLLHQTFQVQTKQNDTLEHMAERISTGIGDVLSNQLPASVANALEPLAAEIRQLAQKFSGGNESALENVLQEFLLQLRQSSSDDIQGLVESVKTLKGSLDDLVVNMKSTGENLGSDTKQSSERMTDMLEKFVVSFAPVQEGIGQFGQALLSLEKIAGKIEQAGGSISGAADISNQSMSKLAGTVVDISSNLAPMQELIGALSLSLGKVDETALNLKSAGGVIAVAADGFRSSAASIEQAQGRFNQKVQVFEAVADGISGTVNLLEKASGQVSAASQPLTTVSSVMTRTIQVMQETEERMQRNQQEMNLMLSGLQKFAETVPNLWEQYKERFDKVDVDLGNAFGTLAKGSEEFRASVEGFVREVDEHFSKSVGALSGAVQELTEEREQAAVKNIPGAN